MSTAVAQPSIETLPRTPGSRRSIPCLENGATLGAAEFLRRYENEPEIKKAELVEGIVYIMSSPVRYDVHGNPHSLIQTCIGIYAIATGLRHADNCTITFGPDDVFQPDGMLFRFGKDGGNVTLDERGYLVGAPDLVVEVSASSKSLDLGKKKEVYRRSGVPEYIAWCTEEDVSFNWWMLQNGVYVPLPADADGILRSRAFPGFWLDEKALLAGDGARVLAVLHEGLRSVGKMAGR